MFVFIWIKEELLSAITLRKDGVHVSVCEARRGLRSFANSGVFFDLSLLPKPGRPARPSSGLTRHSGAAAGVPSGAGVRDRSAGLPRAAF